MIEVNKCNEDYKLHCIEKEELHSHTENNFTKDKTNWRKHMKIKPFLITTIIMLIMLFGINSVFATETLNNQQPENEIQTMANEDIMLIALNANSPLIRNLTDLGLPTKTKIYVRTTSEASYEKEWEGIIDKERVEPLIDLIGSNPVELYRGVNSIYVEEGYKVAGYSSNVATESAEYGKYGFTVETSKSASGIDQDYTITYILKKGGTEVDRTTRTVKYSMDANYSVNGTYYETLYDAYMAIVGPNGTGTTGTIKVERDNIDASRFIVERGKDITINTNGKTVTKTAYTIENNGTLTIDGTGTIQTADANINTIETLITNNGTLNVKNGNLIHKGHHIDLYWFVIGDDSNSHTTRSTINISGGNILATLSNGVTTKFNGRGIILRNATLNMTGGTIKVDVDNTRTTNDKNSVGIEVNGSNYVPIANISAGTIDVTGGYGIYNYSGVAGKNATGKINITGGNISGSIDGIIDTVGNVTLGTKGDGVKETPVITGGEYGLHIRNGNENAFTFYDGVIKGKTGAYNGDFTNTRILKEDKYGILLGTEGEYKTAKLTLGNYRVDNDYYYSLRNAYDGIWTPEGKIITIQSNTDASTFIVAAGKTITIDTNGQTITKTEAGLVNNGTLNIIGTGTITNPGSIIHLIENNGNLDLNNLTIKHITGQNNDIYILIENKTGTTNINNAKLQIENVSTLASGYTSSRVIEVRNGTLNINGGTIENNGNGTQEISICTWTNNNNAKIEMNINDGILKSKSGMGLAIDSVDNTENHIEINIADGEITTSTTSIWLSNEFCGKLNVKGGSIRSKNAFAILNDGTGDVVIGTKDGKVSKTSPSITGKTYSIQSETSFDFYDGILKGAAEVPFYGTVLSVEDGYAIQYSNETIDSVAYKTAYLDPLITGKVVIDGYNVKGQTLTANVTVNPADATLTYQWYATNDQGFVNGTPINNATGRTYVVTDEILGKYVYVEVIANKKDYVTNTFYDVTDDENNRTGTATDNNIGNGRLTLDPTVYVYSGQQNTPETTLVINNVTLLRDRDYTVKYENNVNVGNNTAKAVLTGVAPYTGTITAPFSITPNALSGTVEVKEDNLIYDATPKTPEVVITTLDGILLVRDKDYTVRYENNVEVGTAKVIVTGIGNYEGILEGTFEIVQRQITLTLKNKLTAYTGSNITIEPATITNHAASDLTMLQNAIQYNYYKSTDQDTPMNLTDTNNLPKEAGVYYVEAVITGLKNYSDAISNRVTLVIYGRPTAPTIVATNPSGYMIPSGKKVSTQVSVSILGSQMLNVEMIPDAEKVQIGYKYSTDNQQTWQKYSNILTYTNAGTITIYAKAYVIGHEELESDVVSYIIIIDKTNPTLEDVTIPEVVDSVVIEPEVVGEDIYELYITEDKNDIPGTGTQKGIWQEVGDSNSTVSELSQGDGKKHLYVYGRDEAGNIVGPIEKDVELRALKIGNNKDNKTTVQFKITDKYLHTCSIEASDILLYVNDQLSSGKVTDLSSTSVENGYLYTAIIEDVDLDGELSIEMNSASVFDNAGNPVAYNRRRLPTNEITVDNTLPELDVSTHDNMLYVIAYDINMKAVMVNGRILGRVNGQYEYEMKNGKNTVVVIDEYGNEVVQEVNYAEPKPKTN